MKRENGRTPRKPRASIGEIECKVGISAGTSAGTTRPRSGLNIMYFILILKHKSVEHGVLGTVPTFQPGGPGLSPEGVRNFKFVPGTGCVSFVSVLSCVVSGGGPELGLTTQSGTPCISVWCSGPQAVARPADI